MFSRLKVVSANFGFMYLTSQSYIQSSSGSKSPLASKFSIQPFATAPTPRYLEDECFYSEDSTILTFFIIAQINKYLT